jgi:hypothetical protein
MSDRRDPPPSATSLGARLRNLCRAEQISEGRARRLIGVVVIGQLLRQTHAGVIKGASNIEVRLGTAATRVSSDLDAVRRSSLERFRDELARALRAGWSGFAGTLADQGEIPAPLPPDYRPHRFRIKLEYRGGDFVTIDLEVSPEEVGALDSPDTVPARDADEWFAQLGLPEPAPLPALPLEHQIAQKLHACTAPDTDAWSNDRAHDLVDLQLILGEFAGTFAGVRAAATRLFTARQAHEWPPEVTARAGWDERYAQEARDLAVLADLDSAVTWANDLIADIDGATT